MSDDLALAGLDADIIDKPTVKKRVARLMDSDERLYSVVVAGESEDAVYCLALIEREFEGETYLNERYVMLSKHDAADDTFMQNGINRRAGDAEHLSRTIVQAHARVSAMVGLDNLPPNWDQPEDMVFDGLGGDDG